MTTPEDPVPIFKQEAQPQPEPSAEPVASEPEPEEEPSIKAPTPDEIRDNILELKERGKEVILGPAWDVVRTYGRSIRDGANAVLDGVVGSQKKK